LPQFTGLEALFQQSQPELVLVQGDTTTLLQRWQHFTKKFLWGMWPDYELMNYSILTQRANRRLISNRLHLRPQHLLSKICNALVVVGNSQTGNTVIDALLSVQQSASLPAISRSRMGNIARCWQRFTDKLGNHFS